MVSVAAQVRGFVANGSAILWRTLCAATGGTGFGAGSRFRGERGRILWRTLCAATGGTGLAQGAQNAETVAANIVRHGRSSGEGRTGPAGTCAPPRFCGARARIFVAHNVRRYRGYRVGAGPRPCGERVRIFVAHTVRRYRGTGFGAGPRPCGGRVRIFVAHAVRRYGGDGVGAGPRVCGARVRDFVAHNVRRYRAAGLRRTGRRRIFPAPVPIPLYTTKVEFRWSPGGVQMKILNNP